MSDIESIVPITGNFEENKSLMHPERQFHPINDIKFISLMYPERQFDPIYDIKFIERAKSCYICDWMNGNKYCDFTFLGKKVYFGEEKILGEVLCRRSMGWLSDPGNTYPTYRQHLIVPLDDGLPFSSLGDDEDIIGFLAEHSDVPNKDIDELEELLKDWRLYENGWFVSCVAETQWSVGSDHHKHKDLYNYLSESYGMWCRPKVLRDEYFCLDKK